MCVIVSRLLFTIKLEKEYIKLQLSGIWKRRGNGMISYCFLISSMLDNIFERLFVKKIEVILVLLSSIE